MQRDCKQQIDHLQLASDKVLIALLPNSRIYCSAGGDKIRAKRTVHIGYTLISGTQTQFEWDANVILTFAGCVSKHLFAIMSLSATLR